MTRMMLAVLAAVMAFGTVPASAQQKTPATQLLAIGIQLGHLREFVAKAQGFYDEEGIDIQLVPAPGSATGGGRTARGGASPAGCRARR